MVYFTPQRVSSAEQPDVPVDAVVGITVLATHRRQCVISHCFS